jgi:hypothetical protein
VWGCDLDSSGSGQGSILGLWESGNEPSGSTKGREFLTGRVTGFSRKTLLHWVRRNNKLPQMYVQSTLKLMKGIIKITILKSFYYCKFELWIV